MKTPKLPCDEVFRRQKREKRKRIFDKIFAEIRTNCEKKYENDFIKDSHFESGQRKRDKRQEKTGQKPFFFHKNGSKQKENGRVDKLPKLHKIKPTTAKAAEEKNLETVRKEISA